MSAVRVVVWVDHLHARVIRVSGHVRHTVELEGTSSERRLHRKSGVPGSGRRGPDRGLLEQIAAALDDAREIVIAGPGTAKTELRDYLDDEHPAIARKVIAVETVDHPSDPQLVEWAEQRFLRAERLGIDT
jgi:stalled ribosome rescue protein Dom34